MNLKEADRILSNLLDWMTEQNVQKTQLNPLEVISALNVVLGYLEGGVLVTQD